jgi:hypothetical protein
MKILIVEGIPFLYGIRIDIYTYEGFSARYVREGSHIILERLTHKAIIKCVYINVWLNAKTYDVERKQFRENDFVDVNEIIEAIEHIHKSIDVTTEMQTHLNMLRHNWKKCVEMLEKYAYIFYINDILETSAITINSLVIPIFKQCVSLSEEYLDMLK